MHSVVNEFVEASFNLRLDCEAEIAGTGIVVAGAEEFEELAKGRPVFHWFIMGALGFLALESGFQFLLRRVAA